MRFRRFWKRFAAESGLNTSSRCGSRRTNGFLMFQFRFRRFMTAKGKWWERRPLRGTSPRRKRLKISCGSRKRWRRWGRLAGGVAHDFNNLLGIVTACSELLRHRVDDASFEYLDNIREAAKRGSSLTRQLLAFSRRQPVQTQMLDLNDRLQGSEQAVASADGRRCRYCAFAAIGNRDCRGGSEPT